MYVREKDTCLCLSEWRKGSCTSDYCILVNAKEIHLLTSLLLAAFSYFKARDLCENLGGEMSLETQPYIQHIIGDAEKNCSLNRFWMPILLESYSIDKKYSWINDQKSSNRNHIAIEKIGNWSVTQPNGLGLQKCVEKRLIDGKYLLLDINCKKKYCSVCNMPAAQTYYLRGHYDNNNDEDIDQHYYLSLELNGDREKLSFEGKHSAKIIWYPLKKITVLAIKKENALQIVETYDQNPFGKLTGSKTMWSFTNVRSAKLIFPY